jgi:hypothetical protein
MLDRRKFMCTLPALAGAAAITGPPRELPRNQNTRPPYSDVYMELSYYIYAVTDYLGVSSKAVGTYERNMLGNKLRSLSQAMLRVRAVLDPATLSATEWEQATKTAWDVAKELSNLKTSQI